MGRYFFLVDISIDLMFQIYLLSAITLFALPNISVHFAGFFRHITLPFMLPVAHIGMVNRKISNEN